MSLEQKEYWERQIDFGTAKTKNFLSEELGNFLVVQGAAVTDFASSSILDNLADLSSSDIFKFGGDRGGFIVEQAEDFIVVRDGTSSQVTDKTMVALSRFGVVQNSKNSLSIVFSRTFALANKLTNKKTLEDGNTSEEAKSGNS